MPTAFVKSHRAFRRWLKGEAPAHGKWFAAVVFEDTLVLSTEPEWFYEFKLTETENGKRRFVLHPIELPPLQSAAATQEWWDAKFNAQIMLCLRHRSGEHVCVARLGTWEALPEWCAYGPRSEWEEIEYEAWRELLPGQIAREMQEEFELLGISVRPTPIAAVRRPANHALQRTGRAERSS
jgi:hypothetical protein